MSRTKRGGKGSRRSGRVIEKDISSEGSIYCPHCRSEDVEQADPISFGSPTMAEEVWQCDACGRLFMVEFRAFLTFRADE